MGWTGPPSQANQAVANYCMPNAYGGEVSPYYPNVYQPQPPQTPVANTPLDYGGAGMGGYPQMMCQEAPSAFQYPCIPPSTHMPEMGNMGMGMMHSQQTPYYGDYQLSASTSSNRLQRNMAEKQRRDKLNSHINDLAALVPLVSGSSKRMDKTSVLRLSATFLRISQIAQSTRESSTLPVSLNEVDWERLLLQDINGVMLIVTSAGKIVFITENIEKVLGHTQSELFGQSLFKITCPEDLEELRKCLSPDEPEEATEGDLDSEDLASTGSEPGSSNSICSPRLYPSRMNADNRGTRSSTQTLSRSTSTSTESEKQRRSCYLRLRTRSLARSEQPQYELVHLMGFLRVPKKLAAQVHKKSRKHKDVTTTNSNEITLFAILRPFKDCRVTETSLAEATRDEYITRHSLDGRIIYSDHRISVVSGYLFKEVSGLPAFNFMHKDDVRLVMIALRQMFWKGESFGTSCYRLKSRTGEFIYLKTHGYLEWNSNAETYASYICVNTLISEEEGKREIRQMRQRFSALIEDKVEPGIVALAQEHALKNEGSTEDPTDLKSAIETMISNIRPPPGAKEGPEKSLDYQFAKAKYMSKALPPVSQAGSSIIVLEPKSPKSVVMSPQPSLTTTVASPASQPPTPTSPSISSSSVMQNRPSVLRLASRQPITIYDGIDSNMVNSDCEVDCKQSDHLDSKNERVGVVASSEEECSRVGVVIIKNKGGGGGVKRQFEFVDEASKVAQVPTKKLVGTPSFERLPCAETLAPNPYTCPTFNKCSIEVKTSVSPLTVNDLDLDCIEDCDTNFHLDDIVDAYEPKPIPEMLDLLCNPNDADLENLQNNHIKLEGRMQLQEVQINNIENELDAHPDRISYLRKDLGKLRDVHTKHTEQLKTLREDYASLQPH